jgi:hypothetical protein
MANWSSSKGERAATDWNWKPIDARAKVRMARISQRCGMCTPQLQRAGAI